MYKCLYIESRYEVVVHTYKLNRIITLTIVSW